MVVQVHPGAPNGAVLKLAEEICFENREGRKVARVRILPAPPFFISAEVYYGRS